MTADWQDRADQLAALSLVAGSPTAWFEQLFAEAAAGRTSMPWDRTGPHPLLASWAAGRTFERGRAGRAVVPGSGLGADAAFLAGLGLETTGFDISPTAVGLATERFGDVASFRQADLFDLPAGWLHGFDLVVDVYTVQAMPRAVRADAVRAIAGLVAPGGTLLAIQGVLPPGRDPGEGPPWKLTRAEFASFATAGLDQVSVEELDGFWRGVFHRPRTENVGAVQQDVDRG